MAGAADKAGATRPLSPHLQVYGWYLTMATSILHRVTGVTLVVGIVLFTWWLTALARGPESFAVVQAVMHNVLGWLVLFGFTAALFYHAANGVRHLVWDAGYGFGKETARQSGIAVFAVAGGLTVLFWLLVLIVALSIVSSVAHGQTATRQDTIARVDSLFSRFTRTTPGCAVGVSRHGRTVLAKAYGMANLEYDVPLTTESIIEAGSVAKQFTAAAVMLLVREGKHSLDDDVRTYLPELHDYGHTITLRHLLTHTSGLRDQWDLLHMARGRFEENRITEADVLEIVTRQKALNFVPGTEYLYSNTGYTLAGTIVRRVSGTSLREFAHERIFEPLGMTDTHFHDDYTVVVKGRAAGYRRGSEGAWHVSLPNYDTYGATSLFTTVGDLLKWDANFEEHRVGDQQGTGTDGRHAVR
jgi:succinate dehydrogenase cytochrome b556 subunit